MGEKIDIILPKNNEESFCKMAQKLGLSKLIFVYNKIDAKSKKLAENLSEKYNLSIECAFDSPKKDAISIILSKENNRALFENKSVDIIYNLEDNGPKEFMHHRNSGLNQVLCKLAKEKDITIGFSTSLIIGGNPQILGRIKQNLKFCKKYGLKYIFASFSSDPYDLRNPKDVDSLIKCIIR